MHPGSYRFPGAVGIAKYFPVQPSKYPEANILPRQSPDCGGGRILFNKD
jgi:hypothetical protein